MIARRRPFLMLTIVTAATFFLSLRIISSDHQESIKIQQACGLSGIACAQDTFEIKQITQFYQKVSRENGELQLRLLSGKSMTFINSIVKNESYKAYWFITFFQQIKYYLVQVRSWESYRYLLINYRNGNIFSIIGLPIISKDHKRFAVTCLDLEAGFLPNRIEIFQVTNKTIKREWFKDYCQAGPSQVQWLSNTKVTCVLNIQMENPKIIKKKPVTLIFENKTWKIIND